MYLYIKGTCRGHFWLAFIARYQGTQQGYKPVPEGLMLEVNKQRQGVAELLHLGVQDLADRHVLDVARQFAQRLEQPLDAVLQHLDVEV